LRFGRWCQSADRFWSKVDTSGTCWIWLGSIGQNGYGRFRVGSLKDATRTNASAHRVAHELAGGQPSASIVMHTCDNRRCVNPAHLLAGTQSDNVRDCVAKGRWRKGDRSRASYTRDVRGERNPRSKLTQLQVDEMLATAWPSYSAAGRRYGISGTHAKRILTGESWR
jgi:hypothetical protein